MRWRSLYLSLLLLFFVLGHATASGFRICAYNLQKFNTTKASNYKVVNTLTRVLSRCDISLLLEVMDSDGKAIKTLLASLNRYEDHKYQTVSSKLLGKSPNDMQQYVFIYRTGTVNLSGQYQYEKEQSFVREPFAVQFQSQKTAIKQFVLVPVHTEPERTAQEIDKLYDVFEEVSKKFKNKNVMFLGSFNAGCAYLTRTDKRKIRLFKNLNFSWLIGDKVDTTVTDMTNCAYDRIVVHGTEFLKAVVPFSAKVFNIGQKFKLPQSTVLEISDHMPVEVILKSAAHLLQSAPLLILIVSVIICSFLSAP